LVIMGKCFASPSFIGLQSVGSRWLIAARNDCLRNSCGLFADRRRSTSGSRPEGDLQGDTRIVRSILRSGLGEPPRVCRRCRSRSVDVEATARSRATSATPVLLEAAQRRSSRSPGAGAMGEVPRNAQVCRRLVKLTSARRWFQSIIARSGVHSDLTADKEVVGGSEAEVGGGVHRSSPCGSGGSCSKNALLGKDGWTRSGQESEPADQVRSGDPRRCWLASSTRTSRAESWRGRGSAAVSSRGTPTSSAAPM
jgi:hypothetical protein